MERVLVLLPPSLIIVAPTVVQRWKWDAMQREVPEIEAYWVENQSHAFCVSQRQSGARGGAACCGVGTVSWFSCAQTAMN